MRPSFTLVTIIALVPTATLSGCSDNLNLESCVPNEQKLCECTPGTNGTQTCNTDGDAFSPCDCGGSQGGGAAGAGGTGGDGAAGGGVPECSVTVPLLDHDVIDAEYSPALDRIVAVSSNPRALYLIDPLSGDEASVSLDKVPTAVSVSPDGMHAVVAHDARMTLLDLSPLAVNAFYTVSANMMDVVYAGNGYVYAFPVKHGSIRSVEIATGTVTTSFGDVWSGTKAKLQPGGSAMYGAENGLSPVDIFRYDISQGTAEIAYDSIYHADYEMCGDLWLSIDGGRIFTRCGNVFVTSDVPEQDMLYDGSIGNDSILIGHLSHAPARSEIALIPSLPEWEPTGKEDTVLALFTDDSLNPLDELPLPCIQVDESTVQGHGRFVFPLGDGSGYSVLLAAPDGGGTGGAVAVGVVEP